METLYTIGHSSHASAQFVLLLQQHAIALVIDVRSAPHSKFVPQFNKDTLERTLRASAIDYLFLGNELGARRTEEACYVGSQARYDRIVSLPAFRRGVDRVLKEVATRRVALMCSEGDPLTCHRTILVCREIAKRAPALSIEHILPDGSTETHAQAGERLVALHKLEPELFGELSKPGGLVEQAFDRQALDIAYTKAANEP